MNEVIRFDSIVSRSISGNSGFEFIASGSGEVTGILNNASVVISKITRSSLIK